MKKNVLVFGLIAGIIVDLYVIFLAAGYNNPNYAESMWLGYGSMLLAFSFIFVGIKNYRDKYNAGVISFGKAFQTGLYITLIASSIYVVT